MRELHGVMFAGHPYINMKRRALLFDKFHIWRYVGPEHERTKEFEAEISFLKECGIAVPAPPLDANDLADAILPTPEAAKRFSAQINYAQASLYTTEIESVPATFAVLRDSGSRVLAAVIRDKSDFDVVPIYEIELPAQLLNVSDRPVMGDIMMITLESFPSPDDSCAWQDILDFKSEMHDKQWAFRRWLHSLATKQQTASEIRDEIEWSLNEYTKQMDRFKLKRSVSFIETYVIPTVEALESFKPSSFLKGLVAIKNRKIELMENEANAKGRECAYVFDARKRFVG
jgi:hypothetical protein